MIYYSSFFFFCIYLGVKFLQVIKNYEYHEIVVFLNFLNYQKGHDKVIPSNVNRIRET